MSAVAKPQIAPLGRMLLTQTWSELRIRWRIPAFSVTIIALGFAIGYLCGPNVAPAVANLVYLPLTFASGLFMPLSQLPGFVRSIAPYLPAYHYGQLGWSALGANTERLPVSLAWLAGYTLLFLAIAIRAYQREESRKFG